MRYCNNLAIGAITKNQSTVIQAIAKKESDKTETSIVPGELVKICTEDGVTKVDKITAIADPIYGAVTCVDGFNVGVIIQGQFIANIPSSIYTTIKIGLPLKNATGDCCCNVVVLNKLKATDASGTLKDAYEVMI